MKESIYLKTPGVPKGKWHYGLVILEDGKIVVAEIYNRSSRFGETHPEHRDKKRIVADLYRATKHWLKTDRQRKEKREND